MWCYTERFLRSEKALNSGSFPWKSWGWGFATTTLASAQYTLCCRCSFVVFPSTLPFHSLNLIAICFFLVQFWNSCNSLQSDSHNCVQPGLDCQKPPLTLRTALRISWFVTGSDKNLSQYFFAQLSLQLWVVQWFSENQVSSLLPPTSVDIEAGYCRSADFQQNNTKVGLTTSLLSFQYRTNLNLSGENTFF